jgi:uncharacterized coiled-coil protein SlyX
MAAIFQLRRGSGSVSLVDGELYVNKGPDSLQYSIGEREITLAKLDELNTGSLNLYGDITASNLYVTGNVKIDGKITVGNETGDTLNIVASLSSSLVPSNDKSFDIGSNSKWYKNLYVETISSSFISGAIAGIGSLEVFSQSVDNRLDRVEASSSLYDNAMSGSKRLYVSPSGSDANDGSDPSVPFRTIKAAVQSLGAAEYTNTKRYTIFVGSGEYVEQNPISVPPGVAIVGDTLRTVRLTAANPTQDYFHVHDSNYFYGLRFLDLKHPAFAFSFPSSTATSTISGGGVSTISVVHSMDGYTDGVNQDLGIIIEGPNISGSTATATANVVSGVITQINVVNGGTNYVNGEKPHISIPAPLSKRPVITTSPYIQNCSSITGPFNTSGVKVLQALPYDEATFNIDEQGAGGGIRIDGNLVHPLSPLESFVADAFTQVNQGGPGHLVINKGYAQFVSCFTTFCTYGFKTANGGFANISNSVIDFGKEGLVSKTYFPTTYNTGSSLETKTSQVSGFVIDENGAGYTGSIASVTITGGGASVQATAEATVNANGSIDEIVLLTGGSGYTTQPSVTIAAPTGAGAIQATTVAGKALISGVSEMLMALESGSRGIDISSNMILNGVDYLVTDVAAVSGQPNQRRVTTYPAPPSIATNAQIKFHQLSNISTGGLVMEYVGSGVTYNALPKYGGVPIRTKEIIEFAPGRVFYSTVDNIGNLKIGDFFSVNQLTGEVTIDANSFNLSGLNAIGPFRRNGVAVGVVLQEVSNNTTLLNSQGLFGEDTAPTQYAVKEYVQAINTSLDGRLDKLEQTSGSLNTFSSSALIRLANLETTSGSNNIRLNNLESKSASVDVSLVQLNSYTSSLKTAIGVSGTDVTVLGNLTVNGTTTQINSTQVNIGENILELNYGGSATEAGIYTKDATGASTISGSLLWDSNLDYWKAGKKGFESKILLAGGDGVLSGSTDFSAFSTSVDSRLTNLQTKSASVDISITNINSTTASLSSSVGNLNRATASLYTSASLMTASISLLTSSVVALQAFSGNVNTRFDNLATYTGSVNDRFTTLATYTGSVNTRFTEVGVVTASLITSASLVSSSVWHLHQFSSSENSKAATLATYTGSVESRFTSLATISGSLILSASAVSSSVWNLNQFSASATASLERMTASIEDHEDRITYIEGINGITGGNPLTQLHIFSASAKISIANLETFSSSALTRLTALEVETANLESFTSSINTTIKTKLNTDGVLSGSNQVLGGTNIVSASTDSTTVDFTITNGNITANLIGGVVSGSSQVIGILGSLNTFSSSALTRLTTLEVETANLESFTSSINTTIKTRLNAETVVSGSSQISLGSAAGNITLATQTTGDYVASLVQGTGVTITNNSGENATPTIAIGQVVGTSSNVQFNSLGVGMAASATAGRIDATNDIVAFSSSDKRFKENIVPIENALEKINQIGGYEFDWKVQNKNEHGYEGHDLGVIAQEIEAIAPELVQTRENGYKAVKYDKLVSVLVQAIKELSAKIDRLENK